MVGPQIQCVVESLRPGGQALDRRPKDEVQTDRSESGGASRSGSIVDVGRCVPPSEVLEHFRVERLSPERHPVEAARDQIRGQSVTPVFRIGLQRDLRLIGESKTRGQCIDNPQ